MIVYTAPQKAEMSSLSKRIFLAGSIEMGKAKDWQTEILEIFKDSEYIFFNPRRKDWDSSWKQSKDNTEFLEQVQWEVKYLESADIVAVYLQAGTFSPISLFELGLVCKNKNQQVIVFCEEGFYRKGNIDIYADLYNYKTVNSMEEFIETIKIAAYTTKTYINPYKPFQK